MNKKVKLSILGAALLIVVIAVVLVVLNTSNVSLEEAIQIVLADSQTIVDGVEISRNSEEAVYLANDIIYYEEGHPFTYGMGIDADEHTQGEAMMHNVIHITKPGTYALSGRLSYGQIAVDLGEDAKEDKNAKVTLILNNANVNCSVAPAVAIYNVYECGNEAKAKSNVNTKKAGANIVIADGTVNNLKGAYVAEIFKSYTLKADGSDIETSETLHKYDGAIYSKMSINIDGGKDDTGVLNVVADKEGIETEMHVTLNGGNINITSVSDGINTEKDGVSVVTINDGILNVVINGSDKDGDGIESEGWIVLNGGTVMATANKDGGTGLEAEKEIILNGGNLMAAGSSIDEIANSKQNYATFDFEAQQMGETLYLLKDEADNTVIEYNPLNSFTKMIMSSKELEEGKYTFWRGIVQLEESKAGEETTEFEIVKGGNNFSGISVVD